MATSRYSVTLVFRKANPGNYSIESIYNCLIAYWDKNKPTELSINRVILKHNFDLLSFFSCLIKSLSGKIKIAHITGGCNYMVMAFLRSKRILTIHDLFYLTSSSNKKGWLYKLLYYSLPIRFCHKIVVVSEQTKTDLIGLFPKAINKVQVIANPLSIDLDKARAYNNSQEKNGRLKIIQIGNKPLKNFKNLLLATKDLDVQYVFVHGDTTLINKYLNEYGLSDKAEVYQNVSNDTLIQLYLEADVLFFASMAEGFGLPLLEAQALKIPIITSDLPPMNTLAPQAILVDPHDIAQINQAFKNLMQDGYSDQLLAIGTENVKAYSVPKIAQAYQNLYSSLS